MPTCGLAFGSTTLPSGVSGTSAFVATRERQIVAIEVVTKGHMGHATKRDLAYVPGTIAWSPPLC